MKLLSYRLRRRLAPHDLDDLNSWLRESLGQPGLLRWRISWKQELDSYYGTYTAPTGYYVVKLKFWRNEDFEWYRMNRKESWP